MALVNRRNISLYDEAKAGLSSLIKQTSLVGAAFLVMLLLTGGNPPGFVVGLSFCLGIAFVAWSEKKRLTDPGEEVQLSPRQTTEDNNKSREITTKEAIGQNFNGVDLRGVDLSGADQKDTNLSGAIIEKARFGNNLGLSEEMEFDLKQPGVELLYDRIRAKIEHEDNLVNQRIMWMITLQGLLFIAYVFSLSAQATSLSVSNSDKMFFISTLITIRQAMIAVGVGSSFTTLLGVIAAQRAIHDDERTLRRGLDNYKFYLKTFPSPIGRRVTNIMGMICSLAYPFLGVIVWMWIGKFLPDPLIVVIAFVLMFVIGIVLWPFSDRLT